jgi:hypothetical protein
LEEIKKIYDNLERKILLLLAISLPIFGISYLYVHSEGLSFDLTQSGSFWDSLFLSLVMIVLATQYLGFKKTMVMILRGDFELMTKIRLYAEATSRRYWGYFFGGLACAVGLFFFQNPGFTLVYAITLVMVSFSKPTPDRIIYILKLKGKEKEQILELKRRG